MNMTLQLDPQTRDLALDETGALALIHGDETSAQCVRNTLLVYKGEWFLDENHGTDYESVMGKPPDERLTREIIREAVFQEPGVAHIDELSVEPDAHSRRLSVRFTGRLKSGRPIALEVNTA